MLACREERKMTESWASLAGGSIYAETVGEGPDALFIPAAWGVSHDFYQVLWSNLDLALRVTFFDPEGTGISSLLPRDWSPARIIDEAEAVRQSMGEEQVILAGHASGAFLSLAYALDHPNRVAAMILVSPFASYARASRLSAGRLEANPNWAAFQKRVADIRRVKLSAQDRFRAIFKEQRALDLFEYGPHYFEMADAADEAVFNPKMHDDVETDVLDELGTIESPVLIVTGVDDPLSPLEECRLIARELPYVRLIELAECGHYPFVEHPDLFTQAVDQFLIDIAEATKANPHRDMPPGTALA
jgi:pimeloyl-ACP methyl ester carboxylesterase